MASNRCRNRFSRATFLSSVWMQVHGARGVWVRVGVGQPSLKLSALTVGGTAV